MIVLRLLLLVLLIAPLPAASDIFKWTDPQGHVHYSDSPPPEAKAQQIKVKIKSIQGPAVVSTMQGAPAAKAKDKVRMYTAVWCGYCKRAKAHLAARAVAYDEVDVEATQRGQNEFRQLGGRGIPIILVGSQRMDGFDANGLDAMLTAAGW